VTKQAQLIFYNPGNIDIHWTCMECLFYILYSVYKTVANSLSSF